MSTGKRPTHRLKVMDKTNSRKGNAGAGWMNPDGSISIVLDPCIVLNGNDPNIVIRLWPAEQSTQRRLT